MKQNSMIAMVLAGGRGSRLYELTNKLAKPAVSYGGKYRIIDFPLSNCANSNINVIGVLTQYESIFLNSYVTVGSRWGLDSDDSGVYILPPREKAGEDLNIYRGTADAITQNIDFVDQYNPEFVLILSGDHIYKMNYERMLAEHKASYADVSIAVIDVPKEEASRFGIMNADATGRILEFEEKPKNPKSTLASMGIYIFNWKLLRKMLIADGKNTKSSHDFGKDLIPQMLRENKILHAYRFNGYWKDVGTVDSLWEANMDLLESKTELDLNDERWKIYTEDTNDLPQYIGESASVTRAFITQGCVVDGDVSGSVLFTGVKIGKGAKIVDSVLMPGVTVGENASVTRALVADGIKIGPDSVVGKPGSEHILLVSDDTEAPKPEKEKDESKNAKGALQTVPNVTTALVETKETERSAKK